MDYGKLKMEAAQALGRENYPARKLALIHTGAALGLSLLLSLISFFLGEHADSSGGLGAMGMQAVVGTVQMTLPLIALTVSPFWQAGFQNAALEYAAWKEVKPESLLGGFFRWKPILTSTLFVTLLYVGRGFIAAFISSQLVMFTPLAAPVYEAGTRLMEDPSLDPVVLMGDSMVPFAMAYGLIFVIVFTVLALPVHYRYRMVNYVLLKEPQLGGLQAMFVSRGITFRRRMELFKLDLQFWWFYALDLLIGVVCYADWILPLVGVELPVSAEVASWGFLLISMVAQLLLYLWAKPMLEVTWAKAFEDMTQEPIHADPSKIVEENKNSWNL